MINAPRRQKKSGRHNNLPFFTTRPMPRPATRTPRRPRLQAEVGSALRAAVDVWCPFVTEPHVLLAQARRLLPASAAAAAAALTRLRPCAPTTTSRQPQYSWCSNRAGAAAGGKGGVVRCRRLFCSSSTFSARTSSPPHHPTPAAPRCCAPVPSPTKSSHHVQ